KEAQIMGEDVTGIDFSKWHGLVDVVSGGFPCQSFSYAGHGKGHCPRLALRPGCR
ncbi:MAG: hypothetical protein EBR42_10775, partial [Betaproteobacteria bacterium]|nr:hypothetical protein [Betaproteobacteria bacterium]